MSLIEDIRLLILKASLPLNAIVSYIHAPWSQHKIKAMHYRDVEAILRPGDVIVSQKSGSLSSWFIPGFWDHASMYCGDDKIVEAVGSGVREGDIIDQVVGRDAIIITRPKFATPEQMIAAAQWAKEQIGSPYDLFFHPDNEAFYCSELIWLAYANAVGEMPFTLRKTFGVDTVTPEDIALATKKWEHIYVFKD